MWAAVALVVVASCVLPEPVDARLPTFFVSRADGADGPGGDWNSYSASVSAGGRFVAFSSGADNLSAEDGGHAIDISDSVFGLVPLPGHEGTDVFVRDLCAGTTTLVSRASGAAGAPADAESSAPTISADGRFVAFRSWAGNLGGRPGRDSRQLYVRDLVAARTVLVSRASGTGPIAGGVGTSAISRDGRFVVFEVRPGASTVRGWHPRRSPRPGAYVRNLRTGNTTRLGRGNDPVISADGRFVAYDRYHARSRGFQVYLHDRRRDTRRLVSRASGQRGAAANGWASPGGVSADGRIVVFETSGDNVTRDDRERRVDVFVRDLRRHHTTLITRTGGEHGPFVNTFRQPSISDNGRYVLFHAYTPGDLPHEKRGALFAYDLTTGKNQRVSRGAVGTSISPDARFVAFGSWSTTLSPDDGDWVYDIFVRGVGGDGPDC